MDRIEVAVTGAAGQVGSVLVRRMLEFPHIKTIAVCRNPISAGIVHSVAPSCDIRIGSITEIDSAQKLLGDCDIIVNCALAMISGRPKESRLLNRAMIDNFSHIQKLKSLIHLSSVSVYGGSIDSAKSPRSTFENPYPDNDYGRSKLYIEKHAKRIYRSRDLTLYILRLGHVIGAKMDRSKQIIELAQNPLFMLPFNGEIPSNTIHIERLAAMIISLLASPVPSGTYNVADKEGTWRKVVDWHTKATGLPPVKGMAVDESKRLKDIYRSRSMRRDVISWCCSFPMLSLVTYPAMFDFAFRLLEIMPASFTNRLAVAYKCRSIRGQIAEMTRRGDQAKIISPYFFSEAMPGPYLALPSERGTKYPSEEELFFQLKSWYNEYSRARWLPT